MAGSEAQTREQWGRTVYLGPPGLDEDQVKAFVATLLDRLDDAAGGGEARPAMRALWEHAIAQAVETGEAIARKAASEALRAAEQERAALLAEAREEARRLLELARFEAEALRHTALAEAREEGATMVRAARLEAQQLLDAARDRTQGIQAAAELEARAILRRVLGVLGAASEERPAGLGHPPKAGVGPTNGAVEARRVA